MIQPKCSILNPSCFSGRVLGTYFIAQFYVAEPSESVMTLGGCRGCISYQVTCKGAGVKLVFAKNFKILIIFEYHHVMAGGQEV